MLPTCYSNSFYHCVLLASADEPEFWWFELMPLLNKTLMCGGLVVLAPGSPLQCMCAILTMLVHMLFVLKLAPYNMWTEDWSQLITSMTLLFVTLGAYTSMMYHEDQKSLDIIGTILVVLFLSCLFVNILITVCFDCGGWQRLRHGKEKKKSGGNSGGNKTQVLPIATADDEKTAADEKTADDEKTTNFFLIKSWDGEMESSKSASLCKEQQNDQKLVVSDETKEQEQEQAGGWA